MAIVNRHRHRYRSCNSHHANSNGPQATAALGTEIGVMAMFILGAT